MSSLVREELESRKKQLSSLLKATAPLVGKLSEFTDALCLRLQGSAPMYARHFLLEWLRCYCGHMDELMLLMQGELMREYHMKQHGAHVHIRGKETTYYKKFKLSSVSIDGLNYEIRQCIKGGKWLDRLGDEVDALADQIERRSGELEQNEARVVAALKRLGATTVDNRMLRKHHKGETLKVGFPAEFGVEQFVLSRDLVVKDPRYHDQRASLSTDLLDPPGWNAQKAEKAMKQAEQARVEVEKVKLAEKEALLDVPLNDVKKMYGFYVGSDVVDLSHEEEDEDDDDDDAGKGGEEDAMDCDGDGDGEVQPVAAVAPVPERPPRLVLLPLQPPLHEFCPTPIHREVRVLVRVPANNTAAVGGGCVLLKIDVSSNAQAAGFAPDEQVSLYLSSEQVLHEVFTRLWERVPRSSASKAKSKSKLSAKVATPAMPFLPVIVSASELTPQQQQQHYCHESVALAPSAESLYVYCEQDAVVVAALEALQQRLSFGVVPPMWLLWRMRKVLIAPGPRPAFDLSGLGGELLQHRAAFSAALDSLCDQVAAAGGGGVRVVVCKTRLDGAALWMLLRRCSYIDASASALYLDDAAELVALARLEASEADAGTGMAVEGKKENSSLLPPPPPPPPPPLQLQLQLPVVELILQHNYFLLEQGSSGVRSISFDDDDGSNSLGEALSLLLSCSPRLERLDLSYCIEDNIDAQDMADAVAQAVESRTVARLAAPREIAIRGLERELKSGGAQGAGVAALLAFKRRTETALPGSTVDISGFNFSTNHL